MSLPRAVAEVIAGYPPQAQATLMTLREMIRSEAARLGVGPLTETLKWGQPAWLTEASGTGTTIRLAWSPKRPGFCQLLVHCQTALVERWRGQFGDRLSFDGNRAIDLPLDAALPQAELAICIAQALTYHRGGR